MIKPSQSHRSHQPILLPRELWDLECVHKSFSMSSENMITIWCFHICWYWLENLYIFSVKLYSFNIINYLDSVIDLKEIPVFKYMLHFMGNKIWSKIETNIIKKSTITIWNIWFQEFNSGQSKHAFMRSINGIIGIHIDHVFSFCWHEERDQKCYIGI